MKQTAHKNHGIHFVLANYSWAWACSGVWLLHTLRVPLGKASFPFAGGYQLQRASWEGVGLLAHGPLSVLEPVQITCVLPRSL